MEKRKIRIGIDVGGTFTHAVALDNSTYKLIAHSVTPTTHSSKLSVSEGIIEVFHDVLKKCEASPDEVVFVAHSTTQATNALLEGDVCKVGVVGMGTGLEGMKAKSDTSSEDIELSDKKYLHSESIFVDTGASDYKKQLETAVDKLIEDDCKVIVSSEAFGVDNPANEDYVTKLCQQKNVPSTAGHEISQLYGLKVRTRTAVINASILPKMTETANLTDYSIRQSGITAPLMIMRSDGGVMDIEQMRSRPILTLLSGPAAGIAAALMYANISDGIFLEVGGTSTDMSAIKNGRAMFKSASIGGHTTYLKTLDSRTVGIGGGSMVRIGPDGRVVDTGPRSAHIAGMAYFAFADEQEFNNLKVVQLAPKADDPSDYTVLENDKGTRFALTLTDAAMMAGVSKEGDYAYGNMNNVKKGFDILAAYFKVDAEGLAKDILNHAVNHIKPVVTDLQRDYEMDSSTLQLVGGGGGSTSIVPWVAQSMKLKYQIAQNAEVISAIGAAMAMLRDMVEKTIINPTSEDIASVRKQAVNSLLSMGADPNSIEVFMEVDKKKNIVRATATGGIEMKNQDLGKPVLSEEECLGIASESMKIDQSAVSLAGRTDNLLIYTGSETVKKMFGLMKGKKTHLRVLDQYGTVRLQVVNGKAYKVKVAEMETKGFKHLADVSGYSDAGQTLPEVFVVYGSRIADFTSILTQKDLEPLIKLELEGLAGDEDVYIITKER